MKIMSCPLNGPRNISEFACAGEVTSAPDPHSSSDEEWANYIFMHENAAGVTCEWWMHVPTTYWFIAERDTRTDEIVRTYPASDVFGQRIDYKKPVSGGEKTT